MKTTIKKTMMKMNQSACRLCMLMSALLLAVSLFAYSTEDDRFSEYKKPMVDSTLEKDADARIDRMLEFFDAAVYDSIFPLANEMMTLCERHGMLTRKMQAWHMLIGAYHYTGQYNQALHETKMMYEEARKRGSEYGESMAYFNMGNVYFSMSHYEESADAYEKCIPLMFRVNQPTLLEIYPYYCDALEALKRYDDLDKTIYQWYQVLNRYINDVSQEERKEFLANYFIACVQGSLGKGKLDDADKLLDDVERRLESKDSYEYAYMLYYRAKLRMLQGRYEEALAWNAKRLKMFGIIDDKTMLVPVHKQRADILMQAGRFKEAAKMYARTYELSDSLNRANTRTQLNELRTMFKVDELETVNAEHETRLEQMELHSSLQRSRFMTIISTVAVVCLLAIVLIIWYSARKLRFKNRELALRNKDLRIASEKAEASLKMKTDFIHQISHEIRTPLNVLSGFSQILTTSGATLDEETRESINHRIVESTDRITGLVNKILELSEASCEKIIERTDEVSPGRIAEEAIMLTSVNKHPFITFDYASDPAVHMLTLKTNIKQATRVIQFLLGNAVKFMHPQGEDLTQGNIRFLVKLSPEKQFVQFIVEDTGVGVPVEEAEHIFEEFVQLDEYYEGTGVGLTVARSIARRLGGDVVLDTTYTDGARFVFTLPND